MADDRLFRLGAATHFSLRRTIVFTVVHLLKYELLVQMVAHRVQFIALIAGHQEDFDRSRLKMMIATFKCFALDHLSSYFKLTTIKNFKNAG